MTERRKGEIYMLATAVLWSCSGVMIKYLDWHPFLIAGARSLISGFVMFAFMLKSGIRVRIGKMQLFSACAMTITTLTFITANKLTTSANAIMLQYTAPIFVIIISALVFREKFRPQQFIAVLAALSGIVLFFMDQLSPGAMRGNLMALASGVFYAICFVINGRLKDNDVRTSGMLFGHWLTALVGIPVGLMAEPASTAIHNFAIIIFMGLIQMGLSYIFYNLASSRISALSCVLIGMIEPILNPIWVAIFYREIPGKFALLGGLIVIVTVAAYSIWDERRASREAA